jgi:hypothetical protein
MIRPKVIHFDQVDFSKTSFLVAPSGNEKVLQQNEPSFVRPAKKFHVSIKFSVDITPAMYRKCDESTLR